MSKTNEWLWKCLTFYFYLEYFLSQLLGIQVMTLKRFSWIVFVNRGSLIGWIFKKPVTQFARSITTSYIQVNLCQKLLFLHQLTHNMTTDCSLNYKFNTWKFQAQTWGEHVVYRNCFWHSEHFLYTTGSPHVLQKEELLTNIYLHILCARPKTCFDTK